MIEFIFSLLLKVPLTLIAMVCISRLIYLKTAYTTIEAKCIKNSVLIDKRKYCTAYQFNICDNNIIEEIEIDVITTHKAKIGDINRLLVKKGKHKKVLLYEKIYSLGAWIAVFFAVIMLF